MTIDRATTSRFNNDKGVVVERQTTTTAKPEIHRQKKGKNNKQVKRTSFIMAIKKHLIYKMILFVLFFFLAFSFSLFFNYLYYVSSFVYLIVLLIVCRVLCIWRKRRFIIKKQQKKISPLCAFKHFFALHSIAYRFLLLFKIKYKEKIILHDVPTTKQKNHFNYHFFELFFLFILLPPSVQNIKWNCNKNIKIKDKTKTNQRLKVSNLHTFMV